MSAVILYLCHEYIISWNLKIRFEKRYYFSSGKTLQVEICGGVTFLCSWLVIDQWSAKLETILDQLEPLEICSWHTVKLFEKVRTGNTAPYLVDVASHEYQCL